MSYVLFLMFLPFVSCQTGEQTTNQKSEVKDLEVLSIESKYWVSELYLKCIKENLPCECTSQVEFSLLVYDRKTSNINIYDYRGGFEELSVKDLSDDKYEVYTSLNSPIPFFRMEILIDTLFLIKDDIKFKYVYSPYLEEYNERDLVGQLNMKIFNDKLINEEDGITQKLQITESTCFYCNEELGRVNLVSTKNDCENMLILESKDGSVLIYDYLNSCDSKTYPVDLKKKLMYTISK